VEVGSGVVLSRGSGLLGEVAFMQHGVASATVRVLPGSSYYRWERREIDALLERRPAAHRSLQLMVGRELARKLNATNEELVKERRASNELSNESPLSRSNSRRSTIAGYMQLQDHSIDGTVLPRSTV
jgi:CRP-like cAMP-binding protein